MLIFWLNYFLLCFIFYLIGSIPFAFIIVKRKYNINILSEGSGNSGAMNSYEITKSKSIGLLILMLDLLKGLLPSMVLIYVFNFPMKLCVAPLVSLVFGHNFSIWIKFRGGRGLATSAGVYLSMNFLFVTIWLVIYYISYRLKKNVHISNIVATLLLPLFPMILQDDLLRYNYNYVPNNEYKEFFILFSCFISLVILIKHIEPLLLYLKKTK